MKPQTYTQAKEEIEKLTTQRDTLMHEMLHFKHKSSELALQLQAQEKKFEDMIEKLKTETPCLGCCNISIIDKLNAERKKNG